MNAQLRPILDLLREVENINLSPEVLEPELHSIQHVHTTAIDSLFIHVMCTHVVLLQHLQSCGVVSSKPGSKTQEQQGWTTKQAYVHLQQPLLYVLVHVFVSVSVC